MGAQEGATHIAFVWLVRLDEDSRKGVLYRSRHTELYVRQQQLDRPQECGWADAPPTLQGHDQECVMGTLSHRSCAMLADLSRTVQGVNSMALVRMPASR